MRPICIASKGRAGESKTIARLIEERIEFNLFIEPQDWQSYSEAYTGSSGTFSMYRLEKNDARDFLCSPVYFRARSRNGMALVLDDGR
jgi:hypothetical protein